MEDEGRTSTSEKKLTKKRGRRSTTTGLKAQKIREPRQIEFDQQGTPIGDGKTHFASDLGVIARNILITYEDWSKVPEGEKETIWRDIKAKSEKARAAQKNNIHPHYMGRAGYVGKTKQWFKEELEQETLNNPDADPIQSQDAVESRLADRSYNWIKAHTPATSNPPPQTQKVIDDIKHWSEMEKTGEFIPSRLEDVLVKAIGKPEHPGRTRGVGSFVGLQTYFGKPTSRGPRGKLYSADGLILLKEEVKKETMDEMKVIMHEQFAELMKACGMKMPLDFEFNMKDSHLSSQRDTKSSCHSVELNDPFIELLVLESVTPLPVPWGGFERIGQVDGSFAQWPKTLVLLGLDEEFPTEMFKSKETKESGNKTQRVVRNAPQSTSKALSCDKFKSKETKETGNKTQKVDDNVPQSICKKLSGKKLMLKEKKKSTMKAQRVDSKVKSKDQDDQEDNPLSEDELTSLGEYCRYLEKVLCSFSTSSVSSFSIVVDKFVYNYSHEIKVFLSVADIRQMFRYEWLNISILQGWGSFLYHYGATLEVNDMVGYLCPERLSSYMHDARAMQKYVADALKIHENKRYVMGAFFEKKVLTCFFQFVDSYYYYACILDSLQAEKKEMKIIEELKLSWILHCVQCGKRHPTRKNELECKIIKCPQQLRSYECDYYVMKWMYDITVNYSKRKDSLEKRIKEASSVAELDAVYEAYLSNSPLLLLEDTPPAPNPPPPRMPKLSDHSMLTAEQLPTGTLGPDITAATYHIQLAFIGLIERSQFGGSPTEDPYNHIVTFCDYCATVKQTGITQAQLREMLFPFSLRNGAKRWLSSLDREAAGVVDWDTLVLAFYNKYYPPEKTALLRGQI
ncbi:hypothetical protein RND81_11G153600 [Saponaria officinalis]|uniref:Uncharacterized protein n=1 Tax=Saponaria officinalis TaxID=3572 RepID=A0AAW1HMJ1_SAPOF